MNPTAHPSATFSTSSLIHRMNGRSDLKFGPPLYSRSGGRSGAAVRRPVDEGNTGASLARRSWPVSGQQSEGVQMMDKVVGGLMATLSFMLGVLIMAASALHG